LRNSSGTLTFSDGGSYTGEFKNDMISVRCEMTTPEGQRYEGTFKVNLFHGRGIMRSSEGRIYIWDNLKMVNVMGRAP